MVYEMDEPDAKDPNYDESAQVRGGHGTQHSVQRPLAFLLIQCRICRTLLLNEDMQGTTTNVALASSRRWHQY